MLNWLKNQRIVRYRTFQLRSGYRLEDPTNVVSSIQGLLMKKSGADLNAKVTDVEIDVEEEEAPAADAAGDDEAGDDAAAYGGSDFWSRTQNDELLMDLSARLKKETLRR